MNELPSDFSDQIQWIRNRLCRRARLKHLAGEIAAAFFLVVLLVLLIMLAAGLDPTPMP